MTSDKEKKQQYSYHALKIKGRRIDEHRYVMEQHLGRKLSTDEVVHHKDGNKMNNSIENLEVMTRKEHSRLHELERRARGEKRHDISEWTRQHRDEIGKYRYKGVDCYTMDGVFVKHYDSMKDTEKDGFKNQHVSDVANGKRPHHKGYIFKKSEKL